MERCSSSTVTSSSTTTGSIHQPSKKPRFRSPRDRIGSRSRTTKARAIASPCSCSLPDRTGFSACWVLKSEAGVLNSGGFQPMPRLSPNVVPLWVWLMVVCGVGLGCGRPPARGPSPFDALRKDSSAVLERIAWLRQLPQHRPTRLVFHEPEAFAKVVDEQVHGDVTPTSADHPAFQHAFGFAGVRGQGVESLSNVQRDEVVAFFDERTFTVHVRADADEDPEAALKPSWVVAHEVGHSLQHQHFPIPDVARMQHEDERLAALAMLEGDAMLVMLAYASYEQHAPLARTIVRVQRAIAEDQAEQYRSMAHGSAALNR